MPRATKESDKEKQRLLGAHIDAGKEEEGSYGTDTDTTKEVATELAPAPTSSPSPPVVSRSRNVMVMMIYSFIDGASFSVWQYQVQQVLLYNVAGGSNTTVGLVSGASGLAQAIAALVAGYVGDVLEKKYVTRAGAIAGLIAAVTTIYAVYSQAISLYYASSAFWGFYCGFAYPASEALFADSISSGKRTAIYTKKYVIQILCYLVGYALNIGLFLKLGDEWGNDTLEMVMYIGVSIHPIAFILLAMLSDKYNLKNMLASIVQKREQQALLEGGDGTTARAVDDTAGLSKAAMGGRTESDHSKGASLRTQGTAGSHDGQPFGAESLRDGYDPLQRGVDTFYKSVAEHDNKLALPASTRDPTMALGGMGFDGPSQSSFFSQSNFQERREIVLAGAALDAADAVNCSSGTLMRRRGTTSVYSGESKRSNVTFSQQHSHRSTKSTSANAPTHLSVRSHATSVRDQMVRTKSADSISDAHQPPSTRHFALGVPNEMRRQVTEDGSITGADILEVVLLQSNASDKMMSSIPQRSIGGSSSGASSRKGGKQVYTSNSFTRAKTAGTYDDIYALNAEASASQRRRAETVLIESILPTSNRERAKSRMATTFVPVTSTDNGVVSPLSSEPKGLTGSEEEVPLAGSVSPTKPLSPTAAEEPAEEVVDEISSPLPTKPTFTPLEKVEMYYKHRTRVDAILSQDGGMSYYAHHHNEFNINSHNSRADRSGSSNRSNQGFFSFFSPSRKAKDKGSLLHNERDGGGRERNVSDLNRFKGKGARYDDDPNEDARSERTIGSRMTMETKPHLDTERNSPITSRDEIYQDAPRYGSQNYINDKVANIYQNGDDQIDRFMSLEEEELYALLEDGQTEDILAFVDWVNDSPETHALEKDRSNEKRKGFLSSLCGPNGPCYKHPGMAWHENYNIIPFLTVSADFIQAIGSGMTVRFLTLFFVNDYDLKPIVVTITFIIITILSAGIAQVMSLLSARLQRLPLILGIRLIGTTALLLMAILPKIDEDNKDSFLHSIGLLLTVFVIRQGAMNSSMGISRAVVMDTVRPEARTKWSSMESFASFSWAGSAAVGGVIADAHGYGATFLVTASLHYFSCMLIVPAAIASRRLERIVLTMNAKDRAEKKEKEEMAKQLKAFDKAEAERVKKLEKERKRSA